VSVTAPSLSELQSALLAYLLWADRGVLAHVADAAGEPALTRLAIYGEAYALRLVEVLGADYGTLHAHLGDEAFQDLGRAYARARPSHFRSVRWFGGGLADFLASTPPWDAQPHLAELARFDWALSLAFDAADREPLQLEAVAAVAPADWPAMRLEFHPSCSRLELHGNAAGQRRALDAGEPLPDTEWTTEPRAWLVWRHEGMSHYRSLAVEEAFALDAARGGASFGELCESLLEWLDGQHVAMHAASLLKTWLSEGLLTGVHTRDDR